MAGQKKTVRRRLILLVVAVLLLCGAGRAYAYRKHRIHKQFMAWRADGMTAAAQGDGPRAIDYLNRYLVRYGNDLPALREYRRCRALVPAKDGQHISDQVRVLRHILRLAPDLVDDRRELMKLYAQIGFSAESYDAAEQILALLPNDVDALGVKTRKLMRDKNAGEAMKVATRWLEHAPLALDAHLVYVNLLKQSQTPAEQILKHVDDLLEAHPDDPVFEIIAGVGHGLAGKQDEGAELLKTAAKRKLPDAIVARALLGYLDQFYLIPESTALLEQIVRESGESALTLSLAQRYWQDPGRQEELVKLLARVDAASATDHPALLIGLRATAMCQVGQAEQAKSLQQALAARVNDSAAQAWAVVVGQAIAGKPDALATVKAVDAAAQHKADDVYLLHFRAEALARMGERELAARGWKQVAEQNLSWPIPLMRLSAVLNELGRTAEAMAAAAEAYRRSPNNVAAINLALGAAAASMQRSGDPNPAALVKDLAEIRKVVPQDEASLVMHVGLLGQARQAEQARAVAREALEAKYPLGEQALLRLAAASRQFGLGLEQELFLRSERDHGLTAELAFTRAVDALGAGAIGDKGVDRAGDRAGAAAAALKAYDAAFAAAKDSDALAWRMNRARYLEITDGRSALDALKALADAHPKDLAVQQVVIRARATQTDAALLLRTVQRVRALTGDGAIGWKVARARYLILYGRTDAETKEAIGLLERVILTAPDSLQGRLLAARAYQKARRITDAIRELRAAADMSPDPLTIRLQLSALLHESGDMQGAQEQLAMVKPDQLARPEDRRMAAILYELQGDATRAAQVLELSQNRQAMDNLEKERLAVLYVRQGQVDRAEKLYQELLAGEKVSVMTVIQAAELQARQGRLDQAKQTIGRLRTLALAPGEREVRLAQFHFLYVDQAHGLQMIREATKAAPAEVAPWRALITCYLLLGREGEARAALDEAVKAAGQSPDGQTLDAVQRDARLLSLCDEPLLRPVVMAFLHDPAPERPAAQTLKAIAAARSAGQAPEALVDILRGIADRNPQFLPVHLFLAQSYAQLGRLEEAAATAVRTAGRMRRAAEPLQMAVGYLMQLGRWSEALSMARQWRGNLLTGSPLAADLAIAECHLGMNNPGLAVEQLKGYLQDGGGAGEGAGAAAAQPGVAERILPLYARAQKAAGSANVAGTMEPLLQHGLAGRQQWMSFALQNLDAAEAAIWLKRVQKAADTDAARPGVTPGSADQERVIIAQAWLELAARTGDAAQAKVGRDMLAAIVARPDAPAVALYVMASLREREQDFADATAYYRRAIAKQPNLPVAQNNLAMLLAQDPATVAEAETLIDDALRAWSTVPALHDTRATVCAKAGKLPAAIDSIRRAVQLQPSHLGYRLHLVQLLLDGGQRAAAQAAFQDLKRMVPADLTRLPRNQQERLTALRTALEKTASAGNP